MLDGCGLFSQHTVSHKFLYTAQSLIKIRPAKDAWRGWGKVWHCPMCMGFWVGALLFTLNGFTELFTFDYTFANFLICGWMASGTSYFLSMLVNDDGIKINNTKEQS